MMMMLINGPGIGTTVSRSPVFSNLQDSPDIPKEYIFRNRITPLRVRIGVT